MSNAWTGGQYSLFRAGFGACLLIRLVLWGADLFSERGPLPEVPADPTARAYWQLLAVLDSSAFLVTILAIGIVLSLLFAFGQCDRAAALGLLFLGVCLYGWSPPAMDRGAFFLGCLLVAHACLPPAPYGAWAARWRPDPGGSWRMPGAAYLGAWILLGLGTAAAAYAELASFSSLGSRFEGLLGALPRLATWCALGLGIAAAPLAFVQRSRPWLWSAMLALRLAPAALGDVAGLSLGMVVLHGFTFDPGWVRPRRARAPERIFYDGHCGLCHRSVRFILAEDRTGDAFRFAPLESEAFRRAIPAFARAGLPDSMVVWAADGAILTRSTAVCYILKRLGGIWRALGTLVGLVPAAARDALYDGIARIRHHLFRRPAQACPMVPAELQARFDT